MANIRAKFLVTAVASEDNKTTVFHVKQLQLLGEEEVYAFPPDKQAIEKHEELAKNTIIRQAMKSIKARGQFRNLTITLSRNQRKTYLDSEGNPCFEGDYLEELSDHTKPSAEHIHKPQKTDLQSVTKDIVLGKFNGRNCNATTWMTMLETECARLGITEERYCEVIRLFIEGPVNDWYTANRVLLGTATWGTWKQSFLDNFSNKGWSNVSYAYNFKFVKGSISEYALKKLSLLVDVDPTLNENTRVCFIVVGLPLSIQSRLNRDEITTVNKLMIKLNQLDTAFQPRSNSNTITSSNKNSYFNKTGSAERKPCYYCEKIGKPGRMHPEAVCRTKKFSSNSSNSNNEKSIKIANKTELEELMNNEIESKKLNLPPLITLKVNVEDTPATGLYDPGANITMLPLHFFRKLNTKMYTSKPLTFRTMSGEDKIKGIAYAKIKIFNIEKKTRVFVIDNKDFKYDILIGLDTIKDYKLCQDHELKVTQANTEQKLECINHDSKEITINWNEHIPIEKFEIKTRHLDADRQKHIYNLIDKYGSVFAKDQYDIGTVSEHEAHIKLMEDRYVAKKPFRCSYDDQREIEKQIGELLNHGMIEESCSPFAAPVTLAYKKTGENNKKEKIRLCVDFRELNRLLVPESQPFPLIDDIIVKTRDCKWFSALDINMAFWSIPICIKDRYKTGFVTQHGHWQWVSMPFGLKTSPAIFQRILSGIIRRNGLGDFCCNYIDDILIFSKTFKEHIGHLEALMKAIYKEGFKLKFIKCNFATNSIQYLGHVIENNAVRPLNDNLIAIKNFPTPKNQKNIRQFLGKINFIH